mmetsp:Transcript_24743/g.30913  ORF Transcript_24743/g.30913 Transcript_24743/m.30913 type:complete len:92 (-) Transcript_24743:1295-1570(-)
MATESACQIAGLECLRLLTEPTAACMAIQLDKRCDDEDYNVLVFDFGGGTFDVTIVTPSDGVLDIQATKGDMVLGGRDIDEAIADRCVKKF